MLGTTLRRLLAAMVLLLSLLVSIFVPSMPASAAPGDCIGTVFRDHNADGIRQAQGDPHPNGVDVYEAEPGEAGITVTAYDDTGAVVGTATTDAAGAFDIDTTVALGTPIRIEFTWPNLTFLESGPNGPDNMSSVQFSEAGACALSFGVMNPADYCHNGTDDLYLAVTCFRQGDHDTASNIAANDAIVSTKFIWGSNTLDPSLAPSWDPTQAWQPVWQVDETGAATLPNKVEDSGDIGATWGEAWDRYTATLYTSAYMKVGSDFGPGGPGAIYQITMDPLTGLPIGGASEFVDLVDLGLDVCDDPHGPDLTDPTIATPRVTDATFTAVGKCSLGDIDLDDTNETLYAVNLTSKEIAVISLADGSLQSQWSFPATAPGCPDAADFLPFALEYHDGKLYAGGSCTAETSQDPNDLRHYVYQVDPATGVFTLILDYDNSAENTGNGLPWAPNLAGTATYGNFQTGWPAPNGQATMPHLLLTDIEFYNNDLSLGISDMWGDKIGHMVEVDDFPVIPGLWFTVVGGDLACASFAPDAADPTTGTYAIESGNTCGSRTSSNPSWPGEVSASDSVGEEFYQDGGGTSLGTGLHPDVHLGSTELIPGLPLVQTQLNPAENFAQVPGVFYSSGLVWNSNVDGAAERGYVLTKNSELTSIDGYGKAGGLGDIEALCTAAPVEIGNYVWFDADGDGVQDPSEAPVVGATVNLYAADGVTLIATAVTGPDGSYYFDVDPATDYVIKMDNPADYAAGGPLDGWALTQDSADGDDDADSDAVDMGGFPAIMYTTGGAGENDHTLDFGFTQAYDLALKKTLADGTNVAEIAAGDAVTFTLTIYNQLPSDTANIEVVDYIPAGLTLSDAAWTDNGDGTASLTTPIASLSGNSNTTVDITFIVDADATGRLDNIAEISAFTDSDGNEVVDVDSSPDATNDDVGPTTGGDPDDDTIDGDGKAGEDEDDHDVASLTIAGTEQPVDPDAPIFDLALRKQLDDGTNLGTYAVGDDVTFVVTVFNQGEVSAQNIEIVDYLPAGLSLNDADWVDNSDGTASITYGSVLAPGDQISVEITFTIDSDATGVIDNFAEIAAAYTLEGALGVDIDSVADATGGDTLNDDDIEGNGLGGGDEDDHDIASIQIGSTLAKTGTSLTTILLLIGLAALLVAGLIFGVKTMQKEQLAD